MARATKSSISGGSPRVPTAEDAPMRKRGRPPGSKSVSTGRTAEAPKAAVSAGTRRNRVDAAPAPAPKMNKAELQLQVAKLERTVARLRSKNKELKIAASEAREHADALEAQLTSRATDTVGAKPTRRTRRGSRQAAADETDESAQD